MSYGPAATHGVNRLFQPALAYSVTLMNVTSATNRLSYASHPRAPSGPQ